MNPTETDNKMKAIQAPIFTDLEQARQWVNAQSLDEVFYLIERKATPEYKRRVRPFVGEVVDSLYEFFTLTEWVELREEHPLHNPPKRTVRLIECWS